jgi:hypothetical protein
MIESKDKPPQCGIVASAAAQWFTSSKKARSKKRLPAKSICLVVDVRIPTVFQRTGTAAGGASARVGAS